MDEDGEALARPLSWPDGTPPTIYVSRGGPRGAPAPGIGDRLLARLRRTAEGTYDAETIRWLGSGNRRVVGVLRETADGGRVRPVRRGVRDELEVAPSDLGGAGHGDLVRVETWPGRRWGLVRGKVVERIGTAEGPRAFSRIGIAELGIPDEFPDDALRQAASLRPAPVEGRADLRGVPFVTVDGPDARDLDDAVFAEPDRAPDNPDGWHLMVAIADVAWYVRPDEALDQEARRRGNSVYFPDSVVPMLPEALSNDLCSLNPDEDRACVVAHLWFDAEGTLRRHRFERAIMRSRAKLTYAGAQAIWEKARRTDPATTLETTIRSLFGAYSALAHARTRRGALDFDLPDWKVELDEDGRATGIDPEARLDSHRLIEELMIAANIAAAETLERSGRPCMYRVHDRPDTASIEALRPAFAELGLGLPHPEKLEPADFNRLLARAEAPRERLVSELILRAQMRAAYRPENSGHFGLALRRYAHFTSPIRRYADLLVHRALVRGLAPDTGTLRDGAEREWTELGEHLSMTEQRADAAERNTLDRYRAAFLAERRGHILDGHVTGVSRAGLFVTLVHTGATGLVPASLLPRVRGTARRGRRNAPTLAGLPALGDAVETRLVEADPMTGGLLLDLADDASGPGR
ncbi:MAG: ribonuclease R family protein [Alphaproteobacteria bacterium]